MVLTVSDLDGREKPGRDGRRGLFRGVAQALLKRGK
jgi:hypothetical protein